jgi:hypothetical protein
MIDDPTNDTHPDIEARMIAGYRAMSPARKLELMFALVKTVNDLAMMDIRRRHPHADERELRLRLASRTMDPELLKRAFGWDVEVEGY